METSENIGELAAALAAAQGEMKSALKSAVNSAFARGNNPGSKYATLNDCVEAAHPALSKHKLCLIQGVNGHEFIARLAHASGQWVQICVPVPGDLTKMTIQQLVACNTYLRRMTYSLVGLSSDEDDDGNEAAKVGPVLKHSPLGDAPPSDAAVKYADALREALAAQDFDAAYQVHLDLHEEGEETYRSAWALLDSKTRSAAKRVIEQRKAA